MRERKWRFFFSHSLKPLKKISTSSRLHQAEAGSWNAQHNPEQQKSLVVSLPFAPVWLMPNIKVGQEDFREAAAMSNLTTALTLIVWNKESQLKTSITWSGSQSQAGALHAGRIQKPLSYELLVPHTHNQQFQPQVWSQNELLEQLGRSQGVDECALLKPSAQMKSNSWMGC